MIIIKSILYGLFRAVLCFLATWFSMYIGASFCLALGLEPSTIGTKIIFWAMTLIQVLYLACIYVLITKL